MDNNRKKWLILFLLLLVYPAYAFIPKLFQPTSSELTSLKENSKNIAPSGTVSTALLPPPVVAPTPPVVAPTPPVVTPLFQKVIPEKKVKERDKEGDTSSSVLAKKYSDWIINFEMSCKAVLEKAGKEGHDLKKAINTLLKLRINKCDCIKSALQIAGPGESKSLLSVSDIISAALGASVETDVVVTCSMEGGVDPEEIILILRELGLSDYADFLSSDDYLSPGSAMPGENERIKGNVSPYTF